MKPRLAEKAFDLKTFQKILIQAQTSCYWDPYRENITFLSKESYLIDYPKHIQAVKKALLESEVFIFTAGVNECWTLPDETVISRNRKELIEHLVTHKVLTVQENIHCITEFFKIVKQHNPKFKLILTLSPVPLLATGRGYTHHVIEANTHSKAVLRVAIDEVVKQHTDIHYFPSYELVTECIENPWNHSHRHVTPAAIENIMHLFEEMFVDI